MKLKSTALLGALALAATASLAQTQGVTKTEITLGSIQDLSGPIAGFGKQARNGLQLRVDELNVQLVTLRKVAQAQKLSRHLSDKMQEISEKLQQSTMQMSDLKGQQMALRIELQDKLAELTLRPPKI